MVVPAPPQPYPAEKDSSPCSTRDRQTERCFLAHLAFSFGQQTRCPVGIEQVIFRVRALLSPQGGSALGVANTWRPAMPESHAPAPVLSVLRLAALAFLGVRSMPVTLYTFGLVAGVTWGALLLVVGGARVLAERSRTPRDGHPGTRNPSRRRGA